MFSAIYKLIRNGHVLHNSNFLEHVMRVRANALSKSFWALLCKVHIFIFKSSTFTSWSCLTGMSKIVNHSMSFPLNLWTTSSKSARPWIIHVTARWSQLVWRTLRSVDKVPCYGKSLEQIENLLFFFIELNNKITKSFR